MQKTLISMLIMVFPLLSNLNAQIDTAFIDTTKTSINAAYAEAFKRMNPEVIPEVINNIENGRNETSIRMKEMQADIQQTESHNKAVVKQNEDFWNANRYLYIAICAVIILVVFLIYYFGQRQKQLLFNTMNKFIESNQNIPSEILNKAGGGFSFEMFQKMPYKHSDLRIGIVLLGIGIGMITSNILLGNIPAFLGAAFLTLSLINYLSGRFNRRKNEREG